MCDVLLLEVPSEGPHAEAFPSKPGNGKNAAVFGQVTPSKLHFQADVKKCSRLGFAACCLPFPVGPLAETCKQGNRRSAT